MADLMRTVRICLSREVVETATITALVPFDCTDKEAEEWAKRGLYTQDEWWTRDDNLSPHGEQIVTLCEDTPGEDRADIILTARGQSIQPGPFDVPFRPPRDCEWIEWRGHRWGCDGSLLWREDAPTPPTVRGWMGGPGGGDRPKPDALEDMMEHYDLVHAKPATLVRQSPRLNEWLCDGGELRWTQRSHLDVPEMHAVPKRGGPMALLRDAEMVALLMPYAATRGLDAHEAAQMKPVKVSNG